MSSSVLARLSSTKPNLTPALFLIGEYVLKRPQEVIYQTITEIADQSGASEASVLRFCREIGFSSFQQFKMSLAVELAKNKVIPSSNPEGDVIENTVASALEAIQQTRDLLDRRSMEAIAKRLSRAQCIDLYGLGASANTARYAAYRFLRLGLTSRMFNDPNLAVMSAVGLGAKDVAIGISVSGSTKSTAGALKAAKNAGAYTIAMTNHIRSPLTSIPDAVLAASSTEDPRARGIFTSILGQFMIVDILATLISRSNPKFEITLRETAEAATDASY